MESLFANTGESRRQTQDSASGSDERRRANTGAETEKRTTGKDFSDDLQSFLQKAFEESFEEQMSRERTVDPSKKSLHKPLTGLDALIRSTVEPDSYQIDPDATRRLVVTFREAQLEKLRTIAKSEQTQLKKIISDIVEEYISEYEKNKG